MSSFAHLPSNTSKEERDRLQARRRWAKMSTEQRKRKVQYMRRHNEKDGILYYCDYCDVFISTSPKCWRAHVRSIRHMANVEAYYKMAAHVECVWLNEINTKIAKAIEEETAVRTEKRRQEYLRKIATSENAQRGMATAIPAEHINSFITIGHVTEEEGLL